MSKSAQKLDGIITPICTPLDEFFEIDVASLERLVSFQIDAGVDGIFALGSTGEVAFLTDRQRKIVLDVVVATVAGQIPVLAGIIDMTTALSLEHARTAERAGVDRLVLTAPFYAKVSQSEVIEHFQMINQAVDTPIFAYDVPSAVGSRIERGTVLHLASNGHVAGIKDSSGDEANFRGLVMDVRGLDTFSSFTGSELNVDAAILIGANGAVPGLANVDPDGYVRVYEAAKAGDWAKARTEQEHLYRLFSIVHAGTPGRMGNGASAIRAFKTALMLRQVVTSNVTGRPMSRLNGDEIHRVRAILSESGLL